MPENPILLFDGVCNLCAASVQFILKRDRLSRFRFAALQSATGRRLLEQHGLESVAMKTMVLIEGEKAYTRSDAALRIARQLSGWWPLLSVFWIIPRPLRNLTYDLIARNRYRWFGKKDACLVPAGEVRNRFLE